MEVNTTPKYNKKTDKCVPLSKSSIWKLQRDFFENSGIKAWSENIVPKYITTNPFIANTYVKLVLAFIEDLKKNNQFDESEPIYIIELGAGHGKFGFYFIKRFLELIEENEESINIKYVMTDFHDEVIDFWKNHEKLKKFVEKGILDFAIYDIENHKDIELINSGKTLSKGSFKNPLIAIANYVFDSIPMDIFEIKNGEFYECISTFEDDKKEISDLSESLKLSFNKEPCSHSYYENDIWNKILSNYVKNYNDTTLIFPTSSLKCVENFFTISNNNLLLLVADKGIIHPNEIIKKPSLIEHGSFSIYVNFDAIIKFTSLLNGQSFYKENCSSSINILTFLFGKKAFSLTKKMYKNCIEEFSPNDFFFIKKRLQEKNLLLEEILSLYKLSLYDPELFFSTYDLVIKNVVNLPIGKKNEIKSILDKIWSNFYYLENNIDIPFCIGSTLTKIGFYQESIFFFEKSLELFGEDEMAFYNLSICHIYLNQLDRALLNIQKAIDMYPEEKDFLIIKNDITNKLSLKSEAIYGR